MRRGNPVRKATGRKVWGVWDCSYCGRTSIHGSERECPGCGRPRGDHSGSYRLERTDDYLSKEDVETHQNPDWLCDFCNSYNPDTAMVCESCGAERGSKNYFDVQKESSQSPIEPDSEISETESCEEPAKISEYGNTYQGSKQKRHRKSVNFKGILTVLLGISAVLLLLFLLRPTPVNFTVLEKTWKYTIAIEEKEVVEDSGWSLPSNARLLNKVWKLKEENKKVLDHYETVQVEEVRSTEVWDHDDVSLEYEDDGNGGFTENEVRTPVYRTDYYTVTVESQEPHYRYEDEFDWYYYYEYDRWSHSRNVTTSGDDTESPYWGSYNLFTNERVSNKTEEYNVTIVVTDKDSKTSKYTMSRSDWDSVEVGGTYNGKVSLGRLTLEKDKQ